MVRRIPNPMFLCGELPWIASVGRELEVVADQLSVADAGKPDGERLAVLVALASADRACVLSTSIERRVIMVA